MTRKPKAKHDPEKCLGCRIAKLLEELYPGGLKNSKQVNEVIATLGNVTADILAKYTVEEAIFFYVQVLTMKTQEFRAKRKEEDSEVTFH